MPDIVHPHIIEPQIAESVPAPRRSLYSPGTVAAYTVLANIPVGLVLYGLNLRTRGDRRIGALMLALGFLLFVPIVVLAMLDSPRSGTLVGAVAAMFLYKLEKGPFEKAVREGASRARWWPPALWILFAVSLMFVFGLFLDYAFGIQ